MKLLKQTRTTLLWQLVAVKLLFRKTFSVLFLFIHFALFRRTHYDSALNSVFGRPFVKRFALCYRYVVCLSCPVCPVCHVRALWPNGWTDQDETWQAGRPRPWPHCVRWGPSSPSPKGHSPQIFGPFLLWPNGWMDQDATWYGGRPRPTRHCVRWGPSSPSP